MKSFDDAETNTVYMTQTLALRYPEVYWPIRVNLEANGITVKTINKTRNIWIRDYFPCQINCEYVRFQYSFLEKQKKYPQLDISGEPWNVISPIRESSIKLDGGNIVQGSGKVIMTERVFRDNEPGVLSQLEKLFQSEIITIPMEPGDTLGHSDGICKIINNKTILINDYSSIFDKDKRFVKYSEYLCKVFSEHGFNIELMPYGYGNWNWEMTEEQFRQLLPEADEFNPAFGYYINFLQVNGLILIPAMRIDKDATAMETLRRIYPEHNIIAVDCSKLSLEGGLLHCVTANYKE